MTNAKDLRKLKVVLSTVGLSVVLATSSCGFSNSKVYRDSDVYLVPFQDHVYVVSKDKLDYTYSLVYKSRNRK